MDLSHTLEMFYFIWKLNESIAQAVVTTSVTAAVALLYLLSKAAMNEKQTSTGLNIVHLRLTTSAKQRNVTFRNIIAKVIRLTADK